MSTAQVTYSQAPTGAEAPAADPTVKINEQGTNQQQQQADPNARPAWLPEQFKTAEDFAKSWGDQRAEITRLQQAAKKPGEEADPAAAPKPEEMPAAKGAQTEAEQAAAQAVQQAGLDVGKWQEEFNSTRDVSEAGRAEIAKGLEAMFGPKARSMVDDFIEGQRVRVENVENQIFETAGGKHEYAKMIGWATTSMSASEQAAYNAAMDSNDINAMQLAVDGLRARYTREHGSSPSLLSGDGAIGNTNAAFGSTFEMTTAMKDPRYRTDPVYRKVGRTAGDAFQLLKGKMNDHLRISKAGLNLIKSFEGLFLTAYYCPAGVLTIGYGHTNATGIAPRVVKGLQITAGQAEEILRRALVQYENAVKRLVKVRLNQSEFDALVSFAYNCGIDALAKSTLLRRLNKGDYKCVPAELAKYVKATVNGQKVTLNGLVRRRKAEGVLWSLTKNIEILKPTLDGQPIETEDDDEPMAQRVDRPGMPKTEQATGWLAPWPPSHHCSQESIGRSF